jgi:hypothetical protein
MHNGLERVWFAYNSDHALSLTVCCAGILSDVFLFPVPSFSPLNVSALRSIEDPSNITVTWQQYTLVEANGFIEYVVHLYLADSVKRQLRDEILVPMNQSTATFTVGDNTRGYAVFVSTRSLSGDETGPGMY